VRGHESCCKQGPSSLTDSVVRRKQICAEFQLSFATPKFLYALDCAAQRLFNLPLLFVNNSGLQKARWEARRPRWTPKQRPESEAPYRRRTRRRVAPGLCAYGVLSAAASGRPLYSKRKPIKLPACYRLALFAELDRHNCQGATEGLQMPAETLAVLYRLPCGLSSLARSEGILKFARRLCCVFRASRWVSRG